MILGAVCVLFGGAEDKVNSTWLSEESARSLADVGSV